MKLSLTLIFLSSVAITTHAITTKAMMESKQNKTEVDDGTGGDEYEYDYHAHITIGDDTPSKTLSQLQATLTSES